MSLKGLFNFNWPGSTRKVWPILVGSMSFKSSLGASPLGGAFVITLASLLGMKFRNASWKLGASPLVTCGESKWAFVTRLGINFPFTRGKPLVKGKSPCLRLSLKALRHSYTASENVLVAPGDGKFQTLCQSYHRSKGNLFHVMVVEHHVRRNYIHAMVDHQWW